MAILPVPATQYFADFSFDLVSYAVVRKGKVIVTAKGLSNSSYGKQYISFLYGVDIRVGDVLKNSVFTAHVLRIDYDTYNGETQLINAYV